MMQQQVTTRRNCCHAVYCVVYILISLLSLLLQVLCTGTHVTWFTVDDGWDHFDINPREVVENTYSDDGDLSLNLCRACLASGILACLFLLGAFILILFAGVRSINQRATGLRRLGSFSALALLFQILAIATFDRALEESGAKSEQGSSYDWGFYWQCISVNMNVVALIMAFLWRKYPHRGYNIIMTAPQNINQSIVVQQQQHNIQHVHQHQQAPQQPQYPQVQQQQAVQQVAQDQQWPQQSQPQDQQPQGQNWQPQGQRQYTSWQGQEQIQGHQEQPPSYPEASSLQSNNSLHVTGKEDPVMAVTDTVTASTADHLLVCVGCKQSIRKGSRFCPSCGVAA